MSALIMILRWEQTEADGMWQVLSDPKPSILEFGHEFNEPVEIPSSVTHLK